jgi:DNA-binding transcriptional LysR family regulator
MRTIWAAAVVIAPIWGRFLSTYPEVHLELAVGEAPIDIVAKGFDAGIGPHDRAQADMIAVRVMGPMKVFVVGAPSYFARRRPPRTPDDLARHSCVQYRRAADGDVFAWPFNRNRKSRRISVDGRVMVDDPDLAVRAAVDGLGSRTLSKLWPSRSYAQASWSACCKTGHRRSRDCSSIIRGTGRSRPRCAPSST